jgi:aryl sulfotransferase
VQSWWDFLHLPNILFVHYADLLADLEGEIRRVAQFLEIEVPDRA